VSKLHVSPDLALPLDWMTLGAVVAAEELFG
jgi:hypothetical protein